MGWTSDCIGHREKQANFLLGMRAQKTNLSNGHSIGREKELGLNMLPSNVGVVGQMAVQALSHKAIPSFQVANSLQVPHVEAAYAGFATLGVTRHEVHAALLPHLVDQFGERIKSATPAQLLTILQKSFQYITVDVRSTRPGVTFSPRPSSIPVFC
jgi:hypothetical protein